MQEDVNTRLHQTNPPVTQTASTGFLRVGVVCPCHRSYSPVCPKTFANASKLMKLCMKPFQQQGFSLKRARYRPLKPLPALCCARLRICVTQRVEISTFYHLCPPSGVCWDTPSGTGNCQNGRSLIISNSLYRSGPLNQPQRRRPSPRAPSLLAWQPFWWHAAPAALLGSTLRRS